MSRLVCWVLRGLGRLAHATPASCFDGQVPTAACAGTIPHNHAGYDEGMAGLQAALYDNPFLSGVPTVWQTGVGTSDGSLVR